MRLALLSLFTFLTLACASRGLSSEAHARGSSVADRYAQVADSVVAIQTVQAKKATTVAKGHVPVSRALGSGVLISPEGRVLTAAHVVQSADQVKVHFEGGENITAKVLRSDPAADVALLQLEWVPEGVKPAKLANSDSVRTGESVFVVGAPHGLTRTLTVGNISARHQEAASPVGLSIAELFQTDAAINSGNSGGPMFNMKGEVIGIVSHILSMSGGYEGLGFAVTSNAAIQTLNETGSIWSGLTWVGLSGALGESFNLPQASGILVQTVAQGSLGEKLGLKGGTIRARIDGEDFLLGGDVILEVLGDVVSSDGKLRERFRDKMAKIKVGDTIDVKVLRAGEIVTLKTQFIPPERED